MINSIFNHFTGPVNIDLCKRAVYSFSAASNSIDFFLNLHTCIRRPENHHDLPLQTVCFEFRIVRYGSDTSLALCPPQCISGTDTWQRVNTGMPVKSPRFALFDLAEGKSYSFRVRCCNSAGVSEASVSTGEITVGDKLGEPARLALTLFIGVTLYQQSSPLGWTV